MTDSIYTIGHSTHTIEKFITLLKMHSIGVVGDVRSRPYSRMNPQFNQDTLRQALKANNIKYVFLGKELGARSEDKNCYRNGKVQYDLLSKSNLFKQGIERLECGISSYRIALMCAEKEPLDCHRTILVARILSNDGIDIKHILEDGQVEEHRHTVERLIAKLRLPNNDMFRSYDTIVQEAYEKQGNEIAYNIPSDSKGLEGLKPSTMESRIVI